MTASLSTSTSNKIWRWVALVSWLLVALAFLAFYLIELRLDIIQILIPCHGPDCNWMAISPAEVAVLESWGLSIQAYVAIMTGINVLTVIVYWLMGGVILWRQGDTRIGFAVSLALIVIPIALITDADNVSAALPSLQFPAVLIILLGNIILYLFLYLFPNGRFVPRWAPLPLLIAIVLLTIVMFVYKGMVSIVSEGSPFLLLIISLPFILGAAFQIYRYMRVSTPIERVQTRWVLLGLFIFLLGFPVWGLFFGGGLELPPGIIRLMGSIGGWLLNILAVIALPVTVGIAILRYRLWDIDLIIRKTLIYAMLTVGLLIIFFGTVVLLQSLFGVMIGDRNTELVTVASTLAVAALFNPLRRRIQNLIDRRFYRQRYNTEKVMAAFSSSLRNEVDLERLQNSILGVVEETMQPESMNLWLRDAGIRPGDQNE